MDQKKRLILLGGLVILLGLAIYFVQTIPQEDLPEAVEFRAETEASENQLTFTYIPKSEKVATYTTSYTLTEDQEVIEEAEKEEMTGVSSSSPITISTDRNAEAEYEMSMEIMDEYERTVYEDTLSITKSGEEEKPLGTSTKDLLSTYLEENATSIVEENATMGGTWGFVEMETVDAEELIVEALFEDGHIQSRYEINFEISEDEEVSIEEKELIEDEDEEIGAETKEVLTDYMTENATDIVEKNATMGGVWHFIEMEVTDAEELIVEAIFSDGHIQQILEVDFALEEGEVSYEVLGEVEEEQTGAQFQDMAECTLLRCDGEVDCYGCVDGNCKNPDPDAQCEPYEQEGDVGIPYSCFVDEGACQLAQ